MDARHTPAWWLRVAQLHLALWLAVGLWQAYGPWLLPAVKAYVA